MEKIRVLLLDDHEMVRRGIVDVLDACDDIEVVCEAATVAEARARLDAARPDVAVLDVRLPDGSGIELCRDMRASSDIGVVMLTSFDDDEALFAAIMAGAAAFVLKDVRGHDLVDIVRRVHLGQSRLDPAVTGRVLARIRDGQRGDPRLEGLSQQERTVLHLISEGLTNRQIAERMNLAEKTVKNYVSSLLAKLGMERRTQAAVFAARIEDGSGSTSGTTTGSTSGTVPGTVPGTVSGT